ncbi:CLUMA_CG015714, isoform A [Clunio marinus]|uniref:CLUMA_CG015714, isoform A n=1 Tax=Clunio marinus TaxID=568069 RepID=A0A1J1IPR4_9DIPT|nr:CLUMA_CG015714, isoform A [Clunio marinus]
MLGIVKKSLKFRNDKNGLFLKIHHTIETDNSEKVKFSFTLIDVSRCSKFFAAIDEGDNAFVFHLSEKCFWQLANFNIHDCSALKFIPLQDSNILVGNKSGFMYEIDINSGTTLRCIKVFSIPINQFLFQRPDMKTIMALSSQQIKIYDLENFVKKSDFIPKDEAEIKFVEQIPHDNRLFVILHHNIICILNSSLKHIRHFEPLKARKHYLKNPRNKIEKLNYSDDEAKSDHETDMDKIINSITRDYSNGYLHSVCFTQNGSSFCLSLMDNSLMFCSTSMWECRRIIKFPDFFIKRFDYIPSHENNPNMLLTLTSNDELMLLNLKTVNSKMLSNSNSIKKFLLSTNRKLLISIQHTGEILVYNFERFFGASVEFDIFSKEEIFTRTNSRAIKHEDKSNERNVGLDEIQIKVIESRANKDIESENL